MHRALEDAFIDSSADEQSFEAGRELLADFNGFEACHAAHCVIRNQQSGLLGSLFDG